MSMHIREVKSSQIARVGYDSTARLLEIHFKSGGVYHYPDVPLATYDAMMRADSIGAFFHKNIRNNPDHPHRRLP